MEMNLSSCLYNDPRAVRSTTSLSFVKSRDFTTHNQMIIYFDSPLYECFESEHFSLLNEVKIRETW